LGDLGVDGEIILKWMLKNRMWGVDWMHLAQDKDQRRGLVNTVTNLRVPQEAGNILTSWASVSSAHNTTRSSPKWTEYAYRPGHHVLTPYSIRMDTTYFRFCAVDTTASYSGSTRFDSQVGTNFFSILYTWKKRKGTIVTCRLNLHNLYRWYGVVKQVRFRAAPTGAWTSVPENANFLTYSMVQDIL
jgi:hypothetical protein